MNPNLALAAILLAMVALAAWMMRRGLKRIDTKIDANVRFAAENPHTARLLGPLFPKRSRQFDEAKVMFGVYVIAFAGYIVLSVTMTEKALWMLVFGALAFSGTGLMITGRHNKDAVQIGFLLTLAGAATVIATLLGVFPPKVIGFVRFIASLRR